jgi:hypothetical protein
MPTGLGRGSNPNGPTLSCDAAARENERFRVDFVVCCMGISLSVPLIGKLIGFHGRILAEIWATKYSEKKRERRKYWVQFNIHRVVYPISHPGHIMSKS